jgi:hypothetical protein
MLLFGPAIPFYICECCHLQGDGHVDVFGDVGPGGRSGHNLNQVIWLEQLREHRTGTASLKLKLRPPRPNVAIRKI